MPPSGLGALQQRALVPAAPRQSGGSSPHARVRTRRFGLGRGDASARQAARSPRRRLRARRRRQARTTNGACGQSRSRRAARPLREQAFAVPAALPLRRAMPRAITVRQAMSEGAGRRARRPGAADTASMIVPSTAQPRASRRREAFGHVLADRQRRAAVVGDAVVVPQRMSSPVADARPARSSPGPCPPAGKPSPTKAQVGGRPAPHRQSAR